MEVLTTETPTSWTQRLEKMELGHSLTADIEKKNSVRSAANKVFDRTGKKFSTRKEKMPDKKNIEVLVIQRVL